jgi:hypothetical protein
MLTVLRAGLAYFGIVFAVGFLLGTVRVLLLEPNFGDLLALSLELPIMLAVSWLACLWIIERFALPPLVMSRLAVGLVAFGLLMAAELGVSLFALGRSLSEHFSLYQRGLTAVGLLAQIAFALFPLVALLFRARRGSSQISGAPKSQL